jgi:hypothetical protein
MVTFDPAATQATTSFTNGMWVTRIPSKITSNAFASGVGYPVTAGLPGGIKAVTWNGTLSIDTRGPKFNFSFGAAVYSSFGPDNTILGVKPTDDPKASAFQNNNHAGSPESFKNKVTGGALGGGGSDYTGNQDGGKNVGPCP